MRLVLRGVQVISAVAWVVIWVLAGVVQLFVLTVEHGLLGFLFGSALFVVAGITAPFTTGNGLWFLWLIPFGVMGLFELADRRSTD